jgi:2-oxo-4-hydroxy-4-carboxy-5-ureidoimidazoline decarboxylase
MNIDQINDWNIAEACASFERCCGSKRWAAAMTSARPFRSEAEVVSTAERIWWELEPHDWLEAFAAHPRIGDREALRAKFASTAAWASREQVGVDEAGEEVLAGLEQGNRNYEDRFGFIFIVCATGKSAAEMLDLLTLRLDNSPKAELKIAAVEQLKIAKIRLEKLAP